MENSPDKLCEDGPLLYGSGSLGSPPLTQYRAARRDGRMVRPWATSDWYRVVYLGIEPDGYRVQLLRVPTHRLAENPPWEPGPELDRYVSAALPSIDPADLVGVSTQDARAHWLATQLVDYTWRFWHCGIDEAPCVARATGKGVDVIFSARTYAVAICKVVIAATSLDVLRVE